MYFYVSWSDPTAFSTVWNNTAKMLTDPAFKCEYQCSNIVDQFACCDEIFLPSLFFKNGAPRCNGGWGGGAAGRACGCCMPQR